MPAVWPYREKLPELPKEVTCEKCGSEFLVKAKGRGRIKYCVECGIATCNERHRKQKKKVKEGRLATDSSPNKVYE